MSMSASTSTSNLFSPLDGVSPYRGRHDRFRPIHVAIAALKFGLQLHFKLRQIDQIPPRKIPAAFFLSLVLEADNEMDRVVPHLVRCNLRFEIKCAKRTVAASGR